MGGWGGWKRKIARRERKRKGRICWIRLGRGRRKIWFVILGLGSSGGIYLRVRIRIPIRIYLHQHLHRYRHHQHQGQGRGQNQHRRQLQQN